MAIPRAYWRRIVVVRIALFPMRPGRFRWSFPIPLCLVRRRSEGPLYVLSSTSANMEFGVGSTHPSKTNAGQKMELAGTRPTHARAPPGAPSPVKLRQTSSRDAFRRRNKSKYRERYRKMSKGRKLWSSNRPSLRCQHL